jgi:hypothetical protein
MDKEAKCKADLDAAVAAVRKSNQLLKQSILSGDMRSVENQIVKIRASRWKLKVALRACENFASWRMDKTP